MKKQKETAKAKRREFLKLAGLGTLATAAAAGAGAPDCVEAATSETSTGSGYRETEHVRKAYDLSRF